MADYQSDEEPGFNLPDIEPLLPIVQPLSYYITWSGFTALILAPFFKGLAYGLGEGIAYWFTGGWLNLDFYRITLYKENRLNKKSI